MRGLIYGPVGTFKDTIHFLRDLMKSRLLLSDVDDSDPINSLTSL